MFLENGWKTRILRTSFDYPPFFNRFVAAHSMFRVEQSECSQDQRFWRVSNETPRNDLHPV